MEKVGISRSPHGVRRVDASVDVRYGLIRARLHKIRAAGHSPCPFLHLPKRSPGLRVVRKPGEGTAWCPGLESNQHDLSVTAPSRQRVYQFRHPGEGYCYVCRYYNLSCVV